MSEFDEERTTESSEKLLCAENLEMLEKNLRGIDKPRLRRRRKEKVARGETSGINADPISALKTRHKFLALLQSAETCGAAYQRFYLWLPSLCRFAA